MNTKKGYITTQCIYKQIEEIKEQIEWQKAHGNVAEREKLEFEKQILENLLIYEI